MLITDPNYARDLVYKQPKLDLQKGDDYKQKKEKIEGYKKVSRALLKKDTSRV